MRDQNSAPVRGRIVQVLDAYPVQLVNGTVCVYLEYSHQDAVEMPVTLSVWDARRLMALLSQSLSTVGDPIGDSVFSLLAESDEFSEGWRERVDPDAPPLPAAKAKSRRRKK